MKKKILALTLALALMAVIFTGCSKDKAPVDDNKPADVVYSVQNDLTDGMYLIKTEVSDKGNFAMANLQVKDGQVEDLNYNEYLVGSGETKNDSNYPYAEGIAVIKDLNEQFNEKKDIDAVDFDAVTGATHTKADFKELTTKLLDKAAKGETHEPVYNDGVYEAKAEEDSHGWLSEIVVNVQNGQIVGVGYAEIAIEDSEGVKKGDRKSEDNYDFHTTFEVVKAIQKLVINNNGTENLDLDSITGATSTRTTMIELVDAALSTAK